MIRNFIFNIFGRALAACPLAVDAIIARAKRRPYSDIVDQHGEVYMRRWWLFNPYNTSDRFPWRYLPSVRVHEIVRPDRDQHLHDHPWNARTIIMRGGYIEKRETVPPFKARLAGHSYLLKFGEFHRIATIMGDSAWTIFITYRYRGAWGFKVDGVKVPWREYLAARDAVVPVQAARLPVLRFRGSK